jgi:SAM-dependent methyltransferase
LDPKEVVEAGYDRMAEGYLAARGESDPVTLGAMEDLARGLRAGAAVLDLGCGAGVPATRWLAQRGYVVTGVDVSSRQLELARQLVPGATFIKGDMTSLDFPPGTFDAVVALYSIIHVPREEQAGLIGKITVWLRPGGAFLATWPLTDWEGEEANWEGWGATMWWSHYDRDTYMEMLKSTGFAIASAEVRTQDNGETWLWALARKEG